MLFERTRTIKVKTLKIVACSDSYNMLIMVSYNFNYLSYVLYYFIIIITIRYMSTCIVCSLLFKVKTQYAFNVH